MGRWARHAWREARAWIEELWPAALVAVASFGVATVVLPDYRAAITAVMGVATAAGRSLLSRPQRQRSTAMIGAAAVAVLDTRLLVGETDPMTASFPITYHLSSGAPVTLRSFVELARRGRLAEELDAGEQSRHLAEDLERLRDFLDGTATRCLLDLPAWRTTSGDLVSALSLGTTELHALGTAGDDLLMARGDDAATPPLRERVTELHAELARALRDAGDAAEKLERRADPDSAAQRARDRAAAAPLVLKDRRFANRAALEAARALWTEADAERRIGSQTWASRAKRLEDARERFAGLMNVEAKRMDERTLETSREAQKHVWDAIAAANDGPQAQLSLALPPDQRPDGAAQLAAIKSVEASAKLAEAVIAIARDVAALAKIELP